MTVVRALLVLFAALFTQAVFNHAHAVLSIKITQGIEDAQPIAIVPFQWQGAANALPDDIAGIIAADLQRTGRFKAIAEQDLPARPFDGSQIEFRDWRRLGVESLVVGRLLPQADGSYQVQFQLFDIFKGQQIAGYRIPAEGNELRRTAHQIADIVYEKLTGEPGAFATYIAYVTQNKGAGKNEYSLQVSDSDGYNPQSIVRSPEPILSPAWSHDSRRLAYVSFEKQQPAVFIQDLATGRRERIANFPGINSAPAWSPDGQQLALVLSKDGNPEIYVMHLKTRKLKRLTFSSSIDTEPAWSPDGREIAFTSDRGGKPQIYKLGLDGSRPQRVTFEGAYNARPRYAPDGQSLVVVHGDQGAYRIAVFDLASGNLRVLTDARLDESPSFAPNGAMIIYATTRAHGGSLAAVSTDGRVHQRLSVNGQTIREPAWSPFLR